MVLNNLKLGKVVAFDYDKEICDYNLITVDCNEVIVAKGEIQ